MDRSERRESRKKKVEEHVTKIVDTVKEKFKQLGTPCHLLDFAKLVVGIADDDRRTWTPQEQHMIPVIESTASTELVKLYLGNPAIIATDDKAPMIGDIARMRTYVDLMCPSVKPTPQQKPKRHKEKNDGTSRRQRNQDE